jgi:hypothetical protein
MKDTASTTVTNLFLVLTLTLLTYLNSDKSLFLASTLHWHPSLPGLLCTLLARRGHDSLTPLNGRLLHVRVSCGLAIDAHEPRNNSRFVPLYSTFNSLHHRLSLVTLPFRGLARCALRFAPSFPPSCNGICIRQHTLMSSIVMYRRSNAAKGMLLAPYCMAWRLDKVFFPYKIQFFHFSIWAGKGSSQWDLLRRSVSSRNAKLMP